MTSHARGQLTAPTAHLVWSAAAPSWVLDSRDLCSSEAHRSAAQGPALPVSLVPGCASTLAPMQLVGPGLELWLASGFSGTHRPAGAALGRAHSPCLASCSRSARTAVGQEALVAPGPRVKLPPGSGPPPQIPPQRGSLLVAS